MTQGLIPRPRTQKIRGLEPSFGGQTLSRPRTGMLTDEGHNAQKNRQLSRNFSYSQKKRSLRGLNKS